MKTSLCFLSVRRWVFCLLGLLLFFNFISPHRPPGRAGLLPDKPKASQPKSKGVLFRKQSVRSTGATDPIRFTIRTTKSSISIGEQVDVVVKAQLLNLSPNLMFFTPGSNGYTLKLLLPEDFQLTSSDLPEFVTDELTYPSRTEVTYHVYGYFTSATDGSCFRLLRGPKQSNGSSLFEEKTRLCINLNPQQTKSGRLAVENSLEKGNPRLTVLAPSLSSGSQANLTSTCTSFAEVCSGNQYEVRNQTISVPSNNSYVLSFRYKAPEKLVNAIVRVDGTELATVASAQTGSYQTQTVATLTLTAGTHTIGLSSGTSGGYICFDQLCLDPSSGCSPPAAPSINTTGGSQVCNGSSVNLTASGCSGQVTWSNGAAGNSININSAGTYSATCSDGGCTSSASNAITITACPGNACTSFAEVCSGNQYEVRNQTISVPSNNSYVLSFRYKAPEKLVNAIVRVDGTELATVASAQTGSYQTQTVATLTLTAGTHTIGLSSGTGGGYICFDQLCLNPSSGCSPPAAPSISTTGGSQVCNGSSVNLTASGCSGQVNWSNGAAGNSINVNSAGTYSATCQVDNCTSSASNAITITSCVPNELTGRYNYSSNGAQSLLTIQAATNEGVQLKFERQDGTSFTTTNPDGVQIVSGTYYSPATLANAPDAFTRQWQLYSGTVPLKLTFKRDSNGETSVYQFIPVNGAYQHPLDNSDQCGFTLTAPNNANVSCGASVNLAGSCTGDCNGVTYSWSGTGLNATGLTATFNAPATNGNYTYTLTASGAGCSKTANTALIVSGCPSTTGVYSYRGDDFNYTPLAPTSTTDVFPVFENDKIKVKLALRNQIMTSQEPGMGGAVYQIFNKQHNTTHTLVYNPNRYNGDDNAAVDRSGTPNRIFLGQGLSDCEYASPRPFYTNEADGAAGSSYPVNGINPAGTDGYLGFNPNEGGDDLMNSGQLQTYGRNGNSFYVKTKPPIYGQNRYFPPNDQVIFEKWGTLNDRALVLNYQSNWNRTNPKDMDRHVSKGQEIPCLYVNGLRVFKWYDGTNPYGNEGVTTITASLTANNRNGVGMNGGREGAVHLSEPLIWVGGTDGYGIGLIIKDNIKAAYGFWGDGGYDAANPSMGGSYASITASPQEIIDNKLIWRHRAEVVVGTYEECRNYMYTISYRPEFTPKFKFNVPGRHGWYLNSGDNDDRHTWDDTFDGNNRQGWKVYFGAGKDAAIKSPGVIWKASQINKIYIRYKYVGNQPQWMLNFARNRQKADGNIDPTSRFASEEAIRYSNGSANVPAQNIFFNVVGDGQWHTAEVNVSGSSAWQGVINQISLYPHPYSDGRSYNAGEYCIIDWVNSENADPNP